jgi:cell shape-determining protein MreC
MRPLQDRKKTKVLATTVIVIVSIVVLFFISKFIFPTLGNGARNVLSPIFSFERFVSGGINNFFVFLKSKSSLDRQNKELIEANKEYLARMEQLNLLKKENDELKSALSRFGDRKMILGTISAKPGRSIYDTLVLDVGIQDGVKIGKNVFAYDGILIGTISEVGNDTSLVKLFSSPGEKTQIRIEGLNIDVEITGRGGGNFNMEIPRDLVVLPNTNVFIPNNNISIVAKVSAKISKEGDSVQSFLLVTPVNVNQLNFVYIEE